MTPDKIRAVLQEYFQRLAWLFGGAPQRNQVATGLREQVPHIMWMCEETSKFLNDGRIEKAMRWLGFIQGWLWASGISSAGEEFSRE
jgi:hypothetical protein